MWEYGEIFCGISYEGGAEGGAEVGYLSDLFQMIYFLIAKNYVVGKTIERAIET
jgi:hypothetical protein